MLINKKKLRTNLVQDNEIDRRFIFIVVVVNRMTIIFIKIRWSQAMMIDDNDIVILLIVLYEAAIDMIVSLTIDACFVEMFDCSATFRERTKTRVLAATRETRLSHRTISRLNENDIQVRERWKSIWAKVILSRTNFTFNLRRINNLRFCELWMYSINYWSLITRIEFWWEVVAILTTTTL
jgi:hypothetical protein